VPYLVLSDCIESFTDFPFFPAYSVQRPPQFDAWIDMYGGEDFEHEVKDYIAMNNKACQSADVETLKNMEKHFLTCCKLEHMFWDQAQEQMQWPVIA
jgi:thiaminase/transcriptional activator TenA